MLWEYILILFVVALFGTILGFHRNIDRLGQVYMLLVSGASWLAFGVSLLKITFKWGGSTSVVSYTYIPSSESNFVYIFLALGLLNILIGIIRAWTLTYQPIIDQVAEQSGESGRTGYYNRLE